MRHQKKTVKLGRTAEHRRALLANQVCSLIEHSRIKTTLAKAKAVRPFAEKMLTLGKRGTLHDRRNAISYLHQTDKVKKLFEEVAPRSAARQGGYTRIIKLGARLSDSAQMAYLEWVDAAAPVDELAPKEVKAPAEKKPAPAQDGPTAEGSAADKAKRRPVGSRRAAERAKRAERRDRQEKGHAMQKARPNATNIRAANRGGTRGK